MKDVVRIAAILFLKMKVKEGNMNKKNDLLYCVTCLDQDGDLFDLYINAANENQLMTFLEIHENDGSGNSVIDYQLIEEDK